MFERVRRKEQDKVNDQSVLDGQLDIQISAYMQSIRGT